MDNCSGSFNLVYRRVLWRDCDYDRNDAGDDRSVGVSETGMRGL